MRLKTVTTGLVIFGIVLMLGWPLVMSRRPQNVANDSREMQEFVVLFGGYAIFVMLVWLVVGVCAWMVLKNTLKQLKVDRSTMMQSFVEGTLRDHEPVAKKKRIRTVEDPTGSPMKRTELDADLPVDEAAWSEPSDDENGRQD